MTATPNNSRSVTPGQLTIDIDSLHMTPRARRRLAEAGKRLSQAEGVYCPWTWMSAAHPYRINLALEAARCAERVPELDPSDRAVSGADVQSALTAILPLSEALRVLACALPAAKMARALSPELKGYESIEATIWLAQAHPSRVNTALALAGRSERLA